MEISYHLAFAQKIKQLLSEDDRIIGIAIGGSWINNELDEFSDLDFYIILDETALNLGFDDRKKLIENAGKLVNCYTNAHDEKVMTALFDFSPQILHVDCKWISISGFVDRVEDPDILLDKKGILKQTISNFPSKGYPVPDIQLHEKRFWTWMHYVLAKIGRGEILEAYNYLDEVRSCCVGPVLLQNNNLPPRRLRRAEKLPAAEYMMLLDTIPLSCTPEACFDAVLKMMELYDYILEKVSIPGFERSTEAAIAVKKYSDYIKSNFIKK